MENETKNSASLTNEEKAGGDLTWDEADFSWDEGAGTWDNPYRMSQEDKNSASMTNET